MRILLVAAAVALSVTAAQAQEMVGDKPADRAAPPAAAAPSTALVEQLKAAGEIKDPTTPEAPAPKIDAADAKPAETKPVEAKPAEAPAVAAKPAETKPAQAAETKPVKKRVIKRRETDEQKARRIAAKFGVYW